jgi:hypothetical protein
LTITLPAALTPGQPISVVIPTFDRGSVLPRAVRSVLAQTITRLDFVVVDDGSTDDTAKVLAEMADPRMRIVRQEHLGVCRARNLGARHASAPLLAFLDSDDEASAFWLERLSAPFADPAVGIACCGFTLHTAGGTEERRDPAPLGPAFDGQPGPYLAGTFMVRRDLFAEVGGYDEELTYSENTELALRLIPACLARGLAIRAVPEPLVDLHSNRPPGFDRRALELGLASSERVLARHDARLARDRRVYALFHATAGVRAARLGELACARTHFLTAVRAQPANWRHAARLLLASCPPLGALVWGRVAADER